MSFDSREQVIEVVERLLDEAVTRISLDPLVRADMLATLRAKLHYGFLAGHCARCDRIIRIELYPELPGCHLPDGAECHCPHCGDQNPIGQWTEERFGS